MSRVSKVFDTAKSALKKIPGSASAVKLLGKTNTDEKSDAENLAEIVEDHQLTYAPVQMTPEKLEELCNVSRLRPSHRRLQHGHLPPLPIHDYAQAFVYHRKRYARFGAASGVEPGKLWPSVSEIQSAKELASLRHNMTVGDILTKVEALKAEEAAKEAAMRARDEEVAANIAKMEILKEKIYADAIKSDAELDIIQEKRNKRIDKVRKFFQFTLHVKDPRFKEKMQEMVQEEKDALKKKSKDVKKLKLQQIKLNKEAAKAEALKARREAKAKADDESSDDE